MKALKQSISIRSQAVFIFVLITSGWVLGLTVPEAAAWEGILDTIFWAIPIFALILLASYFLSGRAHKRWFLSAMLAVVASYIAMILGSVL